MSAQTASPLLSIIIPHYNSPETLPRLFDSIMAQSLRSLEVVIVDDGSARSCREVVEAYKNKGLALRLLENSENRGTLAARLDGIAAARGLIVTFSDQDDMFWGSGSLERHVTLLLRERADIVHFNEMGRNSDDSKDSLFTWGRPCAPRLTGPEILRALVKQNRGWTVHGKLYTRELAAKALVIAGKGGEKLACADDALLSSIFLGNARLCIGSHEPGYQYFITTQDAHTARSMTYIKEFGTMLRVYLPVLREAFPQVNFDGVEQLWVRQIRWFAAVMGKIVQHADESGEKKETFSRLMQGVDLREIGNVMTFAVQLACSGLGSVQPHPDEAAFMRFASGEFSQS